MKTKLLIVDDEPGIVDMMRSYFEPHYDVLTARNGDEALQKVSAAPDLILLDINMPGMDGLETAHAILEEHPSAKIVMLSSLAYDETLHEASKIGAKAFVCKPFDRDELINTLERVLAEP